MKKLLFILILFCSIQGFGQIKGYWRLDGNANDASGNSNSGTATSITYSQANGKLNQGAGMNGTSSRIQLPNVASLRLVSPFTISVWFKSQSAVFQYLVCKANYQTDLFGYEFAISDNSYFYFYIDGNSSANSNYLSGNSGVTYSDGKWHHACAVATGSNMYVYVDGVQRLTMVQTKDPVYTTEYNGYIGAGWSSLLSAPRSFLNGSMDEVIIDNTAWSPAKVKNEYSRVKGFYQ
jgi:hypothetical protein